MLELRNCSRIRLGLQHTLVAKIGAYKNICAWLILCFTNALCHFHRRRYFKATSLVWKKAKSGCNVSTISDFRNLKQLAKKVCSSLYILLCFNLVTIINNLQRKQSRLTPKVWPWQSCSTNCCQADPLHGKQKNGFTEEPKPYESSLVCLILLPAELFLCKTGVFFVI